VTLHIRPFAESDAHPLVRILIENDQFGHPAVEGPDAMRRVASCEAAVFLVAEIDGQPKGCVRAVYDGSRALIHLRSIAPDVQRQGIGRALVEAAHAELRGRGAPSVTVTVTEASAEFWRKQGFEALPVFLMLKRSL
jgi:N-acetylglutamate synthase-like GNAT family acetyltransferase